MTFRDFMPHLTRILDQLGMSLYARTNFIKYDSFPGSSPLTHTDLCIT